MIAVFFIALTPSKYKFRHAFAESSTDAENEINLTHHNTDRRQTQSYDYFEPGQTHQFINSRQKRSKD
jgi:uncharacterized protein YpmB